MKKPHSKIILVLLLFLVALRPLSLYSQQGKIDSLQNVIKNSRGILKFDPLVNLIRIYWAADSIQKCYSYVNQIYEIAFRSGDTAKIVFASRVLGTTLNRLSDYIEAETILLKMLPIAKRKPELRGEYTKILNTLATAYLFQGKYDKSLDLDFLALAILEEDKDYENLAICLHNIGVVYYKLKNYEKGIRYYEQSLELKRRTHDDYDVELLLVNISLSYRYLNDLVKAKAYVDSSLIICSGKGCNNSTMINAYYCQGLISKDTGKLNEAEAYFLKSYDLAVKSDNKRFQFDNIDYLSQIYLERKQNAKALQYLKEAESLIDHGVPLNLEVINIYARFFQAYRKTGNCEKLTFYLQKYIGLKDSIYNEALTVNLMRIESEYLEHENKARLATQDQNLILKEEAIRRQTMLNISISLVTLCFVVIAVMLFKSNKQRKTINELLEIKVKERTKELELNKNELLKAYKEQDSLMTKTAQDIRSSLATIKGICSVGLKDITDSNARHYIQEVENTSESLSRTLLVLQPAKNFEPVTLGRS